METKLTQSKYDDSIFVDVENGVIYKKGYYQKTNQHGGLRYVESYKLNGTKKDGYIYHSIDKTNKRLYIGEHRLIMSAFMGRLLNETEYVDHINNDRSNNKISNLRITTPSENTKNSSNFYSKRTELNNFTDKELNDEVFLSISDYFELFTVRKDEFYISNLGRLKYYNRKTKRWVIKSPYLTSSVGRYPSYDFNLMSHGRCNFNVHELVVKCFIGERPEVDFVIDHIDEDKTNNRLNNLRFITRKENTNKYFKTHKTEKIKTSTQSQSKKYSNKDIDNILTLFYINGKTVKYIQNLYSHTRVFNILKGKTYIEFIDKKWFKYFDKYESTKMVNFINDKNIEIINIKTNEVYKSIIELINLGLVTKGGFHNYLNKLRSGLDVSKSKYNCYMLSENV
jgi:hypothetical protein